MPFEQIPKHRPGGHGSPTLFPVDADAARALDQSLEVKPGMRAIRLPSGQIAIFRNSSKKPGTFGYDVWHGGWEANRFELEEMGERVLPDYSP